MPFNETSLVILCSGVKWVQDITLNLKVLRVRLQKMTLANPVGFFVQFHGFTKAQFCPNTIWHEDSLFSKLHHHQCVIAVGRCPIYLCYRHFPTRYHPRIQKHSALAHDLFKHKWLLLSIFRNWTNCSIQNLNFVKETRRKQIKDGDGKKHELIIRFIYIFTIPKYARIN